MADPKVKVRILADASQATAELKRAERSLGSFQQKLESTATGDQFASLGEKIGAFASKMKFAAGVVTAAVGTMAGAFLELRRAADIAAQTEAFERNLAAQGVALDDFLAKSKAAADGQISQAKRVAISSKALLLGIPAEQINDLLDVARAKSIALGTDVADAFDDLTTGLARKSLPILDNLAFTFAELKEEQDTFAASIFTTVEAFTEQQKAASLVFASLKLGAVDIERYGDVQGEMARFIAQTVTKLQDFRDEMSILAVETIPNFIRGIKGLSKEIPLLNTYLSLSVGHFKNIGTIVAATADIMGGKLLRASTAYGELLKAQADNAEEAERVQKELNDRMFDALELANPLSHEIEGVANSYERAAEAANFWREALEDAEVNDTIDALEKLGVTLEEDLNDQLRKAEELAISFSDALRAGTISERDYEKGIDALAKKTKALVKELDIETEALVVLDRRYKQATTSVDEQTQAQAELAAQAERTTDVLEAQSFIVGQGLGGRPLFEGLSGGSYTYTQQRSTTDATGRVVFNAAASNFGGLA